MLRMWLAGLLGGIAMFVWGALAHMALPIGSMGLSNTPAEKEAALGAALADAFPADGIYIYPRLDGFPNESDEQRDAWAVKAKSGAQGMLLVHPHGVDHDRDFPKQLTIQFFTCIACSLLTTFLLASAVGLQGYFARVYFCSIVGVAAFLATEAPRWTFYGFPSEFVFGRFLECVLAFTAAGLVIAKVLPKR
jgi:hypothetical protein